MPEPEPMPESNENDRRRYPESPIAGVGIIIRKDGQILMIKRGKEPNKGYWSIPGGAVRLGETLQGAARREVREECSIDVEVERVLDAAQNIIRDETGRIEYHYVIVDLLARYRDGEVRAQSDAEECRWVELRELAKMQVTPSLIEVLQRAGILQEEFS
jgi:8-oxo-dGTP diphosphatase